MRYEIKYLVRRIIVGVGIYFAIIFIKGLFQ